MGKQPDSRLRAPEKHAAVQSAALPDHTIAHSYGNSRHGSSQGSHQKEMTIELDDELADRMQELLLAPSQHLTEITFQVEDDTVSVRVHFRERDDDGLYSAPSFNEYDLTNE